jgi:hypothetical protein
MECNGEKLSLVIRSKGRCYDVAYIIGSRLMCYYYEDEYKRTTNQKKTFEVDLNDVEGTTCKYCWNEIKRELI